MNERRAQPYSVIVNLRNKVFGFQKKEKKYLFNIIFFLKFSDFCYISSTTGVK